MTGTDQGSHKKKGILQEVLNPESTESFWTTVTRYSPQRNEKVKEKWNALKVDEVKKKAVQIDIGPAQPPKSVDLKKLLQKVKEVYVGNLPNLFTRREIRNFPFILFHVGNSLALLRFMLNYIELGKIMTFGRVRSVYFNEYKKNDTLVEEVRKRLLVQLQSDNRTAEMNSFLKNAPFLLEKEGTEDLGKLFLDNGIGKTLNTIGFPDMLSRSDFVVVAILDAFNAANEKLLDDKMNLLKELVKYPKGHIYREQFPFVIGPLIIEIQKSHSPLRKELMDMIYKNMGDPRGVNERWVHVPLEAKKIYTHWLVENDFTAFFSLIERTASLTDDGDRMWKYRQAFWNAYLDEIDESRIILGDAARQELYRNNNIKLTNYDILEGQSWNTSLLAFNIGRYTFIEVSHNGSLRVFANGKAPVKFSPVEQHRRVNYSSITRARCDAKFTHFYTTNGAIWRPKVRDWISQYCGIWRDESQWR